MTLWKLYGAKFKGRVTTIIMLLFCDCFFHQETGM